MGTSARESLKNRRRIVVKIGSALLTRDGQGRNSDGSQDGAAQLAQLRSRGLEVVLVSSGAVAAGMQRLGRQARPHALHELQAMAAVGQMGLVQLYESAFQGHGLRTAQMLLPPPKPGSTTATRARIPTPGSSPRARPGTRACWRWPAARARSAAAACAPS